MKPELPFSVVRAGHAELRVRDLAASRAFYEEILGFVVTEERDGQLFQRGVEERHHHSLVLTEADAPLVSHLAFRVAEEVHLDALASYFESLGCRVQFVEPGTEPGQGRALRVQDPFGFPLEFYAEMQQAECLLQKYHLHKGAGVRRLDHFNCFVSDLARCEQMWREGLGFRLTEYVETDDEPRAKKAVWLHRKGNVHDLALMEGLGPRLHHIGFWMDDVVSIIRVCDILGGAELHTHIERGPGRHGISNAFFLYLRDPDGHRIELYTSDYLTVDPDHEPIRWSARDPRRQTLWGHQTPESWWRDGSPVMDWDSEAPVALSGATDARAATYIK
ncbi:3,4-dihydroxyphenylacetate 2,3-dioxygenase [Alicyclobacillus sendaiensis]|uniref:3,4-dihydroxyphenylacetate 2,3-dioxygenase n=1 Tax=Alicyclobacillus sendaiensis TaxID=192387 RepID=UPI0026F47851|nr:3,4-dihydroxyphenylacetate 2,3-dioxygenase [Alicyclobacillus sendaiensis]